VSPPASERGGHARPRGLFAPRPRRPGSDPATDAPPAQSDGPAATSCDHTFRLDNHASSTSVWLTGSFTSWGGDPSNGAVPRISG